MERQKQHKKLMLESDKKRKLVQESAVIIRSEVPQLKNNMPWPPKVSEFKSRHGKNIKPPAALS